MAGSANLGIAIRAVNDAEKQLSQARKQLDDLGGAAEKSGGKLSGLGEKLAKAGKIAVAALGAGAAAGAVGLFKLGSDFDKAFDTIAIGTGATGDALKDLNKQFKDTFTSVPTDMQSASTAIADLNTRTGATGETLQGMAEQMLEMTRLTKGDLSTNITAVTRVMGDWGVSNEDAAGLMDKLFIASQSTGIGIDKLSQQLVAYGAPLRQMGFGMDTATALLGKFEKEGVNAELVMGSLRIALGKMAREGEPVEETLNRTVDAIKNAGSTSEANALALELFGARAGPDMAAAIREGRFEVDDLVDALGNAEGSIMSTSESTRSAGENFRLMKNRILTALEPAASAVFRFGTQITEFLLENGPKWQAWFNDHILPVLKTAREWFVSRVIPALRDFGEKAVEVIQKKVLPALERFYRRGIVPVVDGLRDFLDLIRNEILPPLRDVGRAIAEHLEGPFRRAMDLLNRPEVMQGIAIAIGVVLAGAFVALTASVTASTIALLANPLVLAAVAIVVAIAAVSAAIIYLVKNWDELTEKYPILAQIQEAVTKAFEATSAFIQEKLIPAFQAIASTITTVVGGVISWFQTNWGTIEQIVTPPIEAIGVLFETTWNNIQTIVSTVLAVIKANFDFWIAIFQGDWDGAWQAVQDGFKAIFDGLKELAENGLNALSELAGIAKEAGGKLMGKIWDGISELWSGTIAPWLKNLPGTMKDLAIAGIQKLLELGKELFTKLWDGLVSKWLDIKIWLEGLPGKIVDAIGNLAQTLYQAGVDLVSGFFSGIIDKFTSGIDSIKEKLDPRNWDIPYLSPFPQAMLHAGQIGGRNFGSGFTGSIIDYLTANRPAVAKAVAAIADVASAPNILNEQAHGGFWESYNGPWDTASVRQAALDAGIARIDENGNFTFAPGPKFQSYEEAVAGKNFDISTGQASPDFNVVVNFNVNAMDSKSVNDWLDTGGKDIITDAMTRGI